MRTRPIRIFRHIGILIFIMVTVLSVLFVIVTYTATIEYYQASTQLLNKDVAAHIAKFSSPFEKMGINRRKADSVFYNAMIISPNVEVYFLDTTGRVIYYHSPDSLIKLRRIPLTNIKRYLRFPANEIKDLDPKDPANPKIFSAAEVYSGGKKIGYIYVILMSKEYRNVAALVFRSKVGGLAIKVFCIIIPATLILSTLYAFRLQKRFNRVISALDGFTDGNVNDRLPTDKRDEFYPISESFNKMADIRERNFHRLKEVEKEKNNFLANISHDLRTPLAVARGYAETLLMQKELHAEGEESVLEPILNKILQVEKLVLQLFELSKMESVSFKPIKEPFIFSEILQEILAGAKLQARQKNILLSCKNCKDSALIHADINMMERVIQNLLENALKYTEPNGDIAVSLAHEVNQLVIRIENSGAPLPVALITWLNNNGGDNMVNRPANTGLGLALVKKILQLHQYPFSAGITGDSRNYFVFKMLLYFQPCSKVQ